MREFYSVSRWWSMPAVAATHSPVRVTDRRGRDTQMPTLSTRRPVGNASQPAVKEARLGGAPARCLSHGAVTSRRFPSRGHCGTNRTRIQSRSVEWLWSALRDINRSHWSGCNFVINFDVRNPGLESYRTSDKYA